MHSYIFTLICLTFVRVAVTNVDIYIKEEEMLRTLGVSRLNFTEMTHWLRHVQPTGIR